MEKLDIEGCLRSMEIIIDTREQPSLRAKRRYKNFECEYYRQTLDYGDYTYNFTLPNGEKLFCSDIRIKGHAVIERKMDLDELASCFTHDRKRFQAEFERATSAGATIYLLIEDATWENLINGKYKSKFQPKAFLASITAWSARYNLKLIFCKNETSGRLIKEILYRELKERLEVGFYG